jgi:hypothetical protein
MVHITHLATKVECHRSHVENVTVQGHLGSHFRLPVPQSCSALPRQCWRCCQKTLDIKTNHQHHQQLVDLRRQMKELIARSCKKVSGSPEREAVLEQLAPLHAAVLALAEKLEGEG